tara:strand:- start:971 stop:1648 length:678 start_codon:yes stop_codon:yes gene_type:complete
MIISHKYKFIFIKTHKTGSTSVEIDLASKCADTDIVAPVNEFSKENEVKGKHFPRNFEGFFNHISIRKVRKQLRQRNQESKFNSYFKFCVEREPVDKLLSHFYWQHKDILKDKIFEINVNLLWKTFIFGEYHKYNHNLNHWTIDGELAVDKILRYENLKEELTQTCKQLGFDIDLSAKAKVSLRKDKQIPRPKITNEQIEKIYDNWKISNSFTGYKIEDCKYYEN